MENFKFRKSQITNFIKLEMKGLYKFKSPLKFVAKQLEDNGLTLVIKDLNKINLNKIKEHEGKNYHWSSVKYKNATIVIRRYNRHFIIFTMVETETTETTNAKIDYSAFTFYTDLKNVNDDSLSEKYFDTPFMDLNKIAKELFEILVDEDSYSIDCIHTPKFVELETIFNGDEIYTVDGFILCMEELSNFYTMLFSETITLKRLSELKVGQLLEDRYEITEIYTEVKNEYYHGVGIETIDIAFPNNDKSFKDVYTLTSYYYESVFKGIKFYNYKGDVYITDDSIELKEGVVVAYNDKNYEKTFLFKDKFKKEDYIGLRKY